MGQASAIEWCDHTFNPWWGCVKVSTGCANCYAETLANRYAPGIWGKDAKRRLFSDKHWNEPRKWSKRAFDDYGRRARVFCASMADVFEDRPDLVFERSRLWDLIDETPDLVWMLLTKRPENVVRMTPARLLGLERVWIGTSVENQETADERIPKLLAIPNLVRWLSLEPLLGPVALAQSVALGMKGDPFGALSLYEAIAWAIVGGESGNVARPMHPEWARELREECLGAEVPFFFKQWGAYRFAEECSDLEVERRMKAAGELARWENHRTTLLRYDGSVIESNIPEGRGEAVMMRVGKKASGGLLDGHKWNEFPEEER